MLHAPPPPSPLHTHTQDRLMKPIAGFAGYNSEMRELAAVISRVCPLCLSVSSPGIGGFSIQDIYLHNPNVHWDDIVGLEAAKRLVKEAVVYPIRVCLSVCLSVCPSVCLSVCLSICLSVCLSVGG